ncbi:MAG: DUF1538 domain-containing protein [Treponema sp.]|nr:DUF1538 domain-containing protein [Treponema sp.]
MNILEKFKETVVSVLPVMLIVIGLGIFAAKLPALVLGRFVFGGILLIFGLTIFLLGVDLGIQPFGERAGAALTEKRNLPLLLTSAFIIGFLVTIAEPDIQVFASQVKGYYAVVNKMAVVVAIALGVGLFLMTGLLRSVLHWNLKIVLLIFYLVLFAVMFFCPGAFAGVAFDSGGATTGPMTVPFILALGLGVSSVRAEKGDSFGLTGITSVGPVMAVLIYSLVIRKVISEPSAVESISQGAAAAGEIIPEGFFAPFTKIIPGIIKEAVVSLLPLIALFAVFQIFLMHMTLRQVIRISIGFVYSFLGLSVFLVGVNGGFMEAGRMLGTFLGRQALTGGGWFVLLIVTGLLIGAVVVCAEPAVWVLTDQVEDITGGTIKRKILLLFLSCGAAVAIALALWRGVRGFSLRWFLIPGYAIALLLMIFSPKMFTAIAFDSGGVASGPITSTFVLSFTLGASSCSGNGSDVFGVIALVAMTPLIVIQILGIIYKKKTGGGK